MTRLGAMLDGGDKMKLASLAAGFGIWWYFIGRKKFGMKGMRKYV